MISKYLHNNVNVFGIKSPQLLPLGLCKLGSPMESFVKGTQLLAVNFNPCYGEGWGRTWGEIFTLQCQSHV